MKKVISILLVLVMCLSVCACAKETSSNEIELTVENYSDYLEISADAIGSRDMAMSGYLPFYIGSERVTATRASTSCKITVTVKGVSSSYQYSDITIGLKLGGFYYSCPLSAITTSPKLSKHNIEPVEYELVCDLNVAGNGNAKIIYDIPNNEVVPEDWYYKAEGFSVEICSISGSVTPMK